MRSNISLKEEAISLRRRGESYNNIIKKLGIKSKGTLNAWFKDLKLSAKSRELLEKNNELAHKRGLFTANNNRSNRINIENSEAYSEGNKVVSKISSNELAAIGASLYWAEGMKSQTRTSASLVFSNSDPIMVSVYMRFIREILRVSEEKIRAGIHIYESIDSDMAKKYWAGITDLPGSRFYIVRKVSKASLNKRPVNILPYGTVSIKVNNRIYFHKVMGMIQGIKDKLTK